MKQRSITATEVGALLTELRAMATLPPGQNPAALKRAQEICFLLRGQAGSRHTIRERVNRAYGCIEILLSSRRWKEEVISLEGLRRDIKSACDRLRVAVQGDSQKHRAV